MFEEKKKDERKTAKYNYYVGTDVVFKGNKVTIVNITNETVFLSVSKYSLVPQEVSRKEFDEQIRLSPANDVLIENETGEKVKTDEKADDLDDDEEPEQDYELEEYNDDDYAVGEQQDLKEDSAKSETHDSGLRSIVIDLRPREPEIVKAPAVKETNYRIQNDELGYGVKKEK